ncbi:MAG TPA: carboxypeptidase-like regulatory domain-containing protein, partial [Membranihabitans sp.]|nr:carboxypeptidase-like regulatory domain-containing protein [Membranihabitans sp.]
MKKALSTSFLPFQQYDSWPKWVMLLPLLLVLGFAVRAQDHTVEGLITDHAGEPLIGVNVQVQNTSQGTSSDLDGHYILSNIDENSTIVVSYIGYETQEVAVDGRSKVDVVLVSDAQLLDEVVVVGYGTSRKKDLTGSIVNVRAEELEKFQPSNVQELLRSSVPGLKVGYSTSAKNTPDFEIRGDNTIKSDDATEISANRPLIVLD